MNIKELNQLLEGSGVQVTGSHEHTKASEAYVDVLIAGDDGKLAWEGAIPYHYRRTGLALDGEVAVAEYLRSIKEHFEPSRVTSWIREQKKLWEKNQGDVTPLFFATLITMEWVWGNDFPVNPNPQRRIQDIKEMGYTLGTKREGRSYKRKLVPLPRGAAHGYEAIQPELRKRILSVLRHENVYELSSANRRGLIPDHKFPEIRWDEDTRQPNPLTMPSDEIRQKFQLLDNQRNQQKREVCRQCFQTDQRGHVFGVRYYYAGNSQWPRGVPKVGAAAEKGCVGCGWYDLETWRVSLHRLIKTRATHSVR